MTTKDKVIVALEKEKGAFVSGEALAKNCNVSRNAIWKSIGELKELGYSIQSVPNRGYMLEESSDIISKAGICMCLGNAKKKIFDRIHVYDELDSTNKEAKRSLFFPDSKFLHGTVIVAKRQTAGRGHAGSRFASPEGGIYLSILFDAEKMKDSAAPIAQLVSSAVSQVLGRLCALTVTEGKDSSLYVGQDKVCGILTEGLVDLETGVFSNYIVGIGIWLKKLQSLQCRCPRKNEVIAALIQALDL